MRSYTTTIGIEIHVELKTKSKMFCGCKNDPHTAVANTHICPICTAHPGTLPAVNKEAVEKVLMVGAAIDATLADYSEFDRKNYFYPDIPKAYQLSQYAYPLVKGGELAGVTITRIHLEEDTARSQHDLEEESLVDFNRAGVPLMELVTEPVIHDSAAAGNFARELQLLLKTLGVSDANMERGEMRVEANISVSDTQELGTKVEVKNLNSFKSMEAAIDYEVKRHIDLLENGDKIIQETRGWDEQKGITFTQRSKESANDYRYFPDPDIPKYRLSEIPNFSKSRLDEITPKLPVEIRDSYRELGLTNQQIESLLMNDVLGSFFSRLLAIEIFPKKLAPLAANYLTSDASGLLQSMEKKVDIEGSELHFVTLLQMLEKQELNSRAAKDLLPAVLFEKADPREMAIKMNILQQNSTEDLLRVVHEVMAANESVVAEFKAGKEAVLQFLVGQGMKATRGSANPEILATLFRQEIG